MKKIVVLMLCLAILCSTSVLAAGEQDYMEKLSSIWLSPEQDADVLATMQEENQKKIEEQIALYLIAPGYARLKIGISDDDEEMKRQVNEMYRVKEDEILKVYYVEENKYAKAYADDNVFRYLISDDYYLMMPVGKYCQAYKPSGYFANAVECNELLYGWYTMYASIFSRVQNNEEITKALNTIGVSEIQEIKYVIINGNCICLYIDCGSKEYLMRVYMGTYKESPDSNHSYNWVDELELYQLYDVKEFFDTISTTMDVMNIAKPTYETEAAALQNEGLLLGNENGLDLLKPLTRIEAATMLLRATGESTETETQEQTFSDVPPTYWGYGAAENAYRLGIVNGMGDNRFAPDEDVTAVQFATMVLRAGGNAEFNWEDALNILIEKGIITQENAATMDFFTRGDMAKMICEAREKGML